MYKKLLAKYNESLTETFPRSLEPESLYAPIHYALDGGGKQLRPLFAMLAFSMYSGKIKKVLPLAQALELFHNFTLLHDDVMDGSDTRRGKPTVWREYGQNQAILSGDAMYTMATCRLAAISPKKLPHVLDVFSDMALTIMHGQQLDMDYEQSDDKGTTLKEYIQMVYAKTACLFGSALRLGAYLGGADKETCQALAESGHYIGIAFQFRDDYLDVYGDGDTFGKSLGRDIAENKKTWLSIRAREEDMRRGYTAYAEACQLSGKKKFEAVKGLFDSYGLPQEGEIYIDSYTTLALERLDSLRGCKQSALDELKKLFLALAGRDK